MSSSTKIYCLFLPLILVSLAGLAFATLLLGNFIYVTLTGHGYYGLEAYVVVAVMYLASVPVLFFTWRKYRLEISRVKIIGIARGYDRVTLDEMSRMSSRPASLVNDVLYAAIASGDLAGTIQGNTFMRAAPTKGGVAVEREVMVTRKAPEKCYKCGASINPKEMEWVGPDSVRCPHCGATLAVKTERI
ncbi:MAG: hypothetical protein C4K47_05880 [Candidatus Thorarchaeota archaeon]|nr:MAG: hypothetical protein C4K47_05880 [Candidatus Thorarchaeota archaeon]